MGSASEAREPFARNWEERWLRAADLERWRGRVAEPGRLHPAVPAVTGGRGPQGLGNDN